MNTGRRAQAPDPYGSPARNAAAGPAQGPLPALGGPQTCTQKARGVPSHPPPAPRAPQPVRPHIQATQEQGLRIRHPHCVQCYWYAVAPTHFRSRPLLPLPGCTGSTSAAAVPGTAWRRTGSSGKDVTLYFPSAPHETPGQGTWLPLKDVLFNPNTLLSKPTAEFNVKDFT